MSNHDASFVNKLKANKKLLFAQNLNSADTVAKYLNVTSAGLNQPVLKPIKRSKARKVKVSEHAAKRNAKRRESLIANRPKSSQFQKSVLKYQVEAVHSHISSQLSSDSYNPSYNENDEIKPPDLTKVANRRGSIILGARRPSTAMTPTSTHGVIARRGSVLAHPSPNGIDFLQSSHNETLENSFNVRSMRRGSVVIGNRGPNTDIGRDSQNGNIKSVIPRSSGRRNSLFMPESLLERPKSANVDGSGNHQHRRRSVIGYNGPSPEISNLASKDDLITDNDINHSDAFSNTSNTTDINSDCLNESLSDVSSHSAQGHSASENSEKNVPVLENRMISRRRSISVSKNSPSNLSRRRASIIITNDRKLQPQPEPQARKSKKKSVAFNVSPREKSITSNDDKNDDDDVDNDVPQRIQSPSNSKSKSDIYGMDPETPTRARRGSVVKKSRRQSVRMEKAKRRMSQRKSIIEKDYVGNGNGIFGTLRNSMKINSNNSNNDSSTSSSYDINEQKNDNGLVINDDDDEFDENHESAIREKLQQLEMYASHDTEYSHSDEQDSGEEEEHPSVSEFTLSSCHETRIKVDATSTPGTLPIARTRGVCRYCCNYHIRTCIIGTFAGSITVGIYFLSIFLQGLDVNV